ncbi:TonB-dependent receptor domain-containing protein [Pedobacter steynii]|uniref:TonB-dependent receptor n=1 Tax=Pedobacter steynii TaxID=430522 RepID=A0A1D7QN62_9SPHI|nr:TonB-dependent receptor [Pedobacter steynii]AOM80097.1 TonB-dependent receptor [Pedobacter steynii]
MFLTVSIFLCFNINAGAQQAAINLSIDIPSGKMEDAIRLIEKQYKITFAYESSMLKDVTVRKFRFKNQKLSVILTALFRETDLSYEEKGNNIIIKKNGGQENRTGQEKQGRTGGTLSGYIEDPASGERLVGVSIYVYGADVGTTSNNYGFYSIALPGNQAHVRLSYLGFKTIDTTVQLQEDTRVVFRMPQEQSTLEDVVITASKSPEIQRTSQMSKMTLSPEQIKSMPKFFGESDVMKTLQLMPGVQQGSEGTSALLVRGGSPDQNLILLDGAPLYNPSHLLGVFSTFNTSTIKNVDLYKGAFPARFGGRLSSVVDIVTKDGNLHEIHGDFSIGILASQLTLEGPIVKGKTSFVLSGRRTYADLFVSPLMKGTAVNIDKFGLYFYDLNFKMQHLLSERDRLVLSLYAGKDKLRIRTKGTNYINDMALGWGNYSGTLRWNHVFSKNLFANTTLILSDYAFETSNRDERTSIGTTAKHAFTLNSGIRDYGAKTDFDYRPHPDHSIRAGAGYTWHAFTPGVTSEVLEEDGSQVSLQESNNNKISGTELDVYAEDDWNVMDKLKVNYGLHWSGFATEGKFYHYLQPRISARYLLPGDWGLKVSFARMAQYLHLLAGNSITLPTDLWVPATKKVLPQLANQFAIGLARNIFSNKIEFSLEGYYKTMDHVIEYKEGEAYINTADKNWSDKIAMGKGKAYGMEVMIQKKEGRLTGWVAYTLSRTERTIPGINFDRTFPYKYDRRHDFKIITSYKLTPGIELSGSWIFQSASPFTIPVGQYEGVTSYDEYGNPANALPNITARNNFRIESYHRLDLSLSFIRNKKNGVIRTWNISVFNAYNRKNPFLYYSKYNGLTNTSDMTRLTLLPVLPSISYSLKF